MRVTVDTRDPWPHPWAKFLPEGWEIERGTLETGDVVLSALPEGAIIERKSPSDMASCIGAGWERFEKELKRGRYVGRMVVVIEGTMADVIAASRGVSPNAIMAPWPLGPCVIVSSFLVARSKMPQTSPLDFSLPRSATPNAWLRL